MEPTMKKLIFPYPFCGFSGTTFINCFSSVYMFLEGIAAGGSDYECRQLDGKSCNSCGNCGQGGYTPISRQECYFFLFDTMCGRSALRWRFDETPTEMEKMIGVTDAYEGDTENNIEFLFGFAGWEYQKVPGDFKAAIAASIEAGKPVLAKVKAGEGRFRVIIGYDGDKLLCPDYKNAQKPPKKAPKYNELEALYIVGDKTQPRYTLKDGLERIRRVLEYNAAEKLWDSYYEKLGLYPAAHITDGFGKVDNKEKQARMQRVSDTMVHTWNCHNFAEVFRKYREGGDASVYDGVGDMKKLRDPAFREFFDRISGPCNGYTHDLAWALHGLAQCADWTRHAFSAGYVGEMVELTLMQIQKNDEGVLEAVRGILAILEQGEALE